MYAIAAQYHRVTKGVNAEMERKRRIFEHFKHLNYSIPAGVEEATLSFFSDERSTVRMLMDQLSWDATEEEQVLAISRLAVELFPWEYIYLVLLDNDIVFSDGTHNSFYTMRTWKSRWENAAKTIVQIGWPKVDNIVIPLFYWLLDSNWPGSEIIRTFLMSLPVDVLCNKMREILENPANYCSCDFEGLKLAIDEICEDLKIIL